MNLVCPHCYATNRVPDERIAQQPKCGKCGKPVLTGAPIELGGDNFARFINSNDLPVIVDFWASWCGPCRQENPALTKVYNEYKGHNFDIIGVSLDDEKGRAKWLKAVQDDHLAWTQVSDLRGLQNEAAQRYHIQAIPQNFLIDPNGKIVAANLRGDELQAMLARYIK